MVAVGTARMVTDVVVVNDEQPPDAAMVYVTVYVPGVLADGVIAPVVALMLKPIVDENVPPDVPVNVTACADETELQNGPAYEMVADGAVIIATLVVVVKAAQPPDAAIV